MKVYKCLLTGDEMFTDIYPQSEKDGLIRLKGKYVTRKKGATVDDSLIGGNASAEEPQEQAAEDEMESGVNVVLDNRLKPTSFGNKKEYTAYFKTFVKALEEKVKAKRADLDSDAWRKEITETYKAAVANFKDYEFYTGNSGDPEGNIVLVRWEVPEGEDEECPFVYFYKEGLEEHKL